MGVWIVAELIALCGGGVAWVLWRGAQDGGDSDVIARYRNGIIGCGFWAALVAVRLLTHAY